MPPTGPSTSRTSKRGQSESLDPLSASNERGGGEGEEKKDRPPKRIGQKMRLNLRPAAEEGPPPPPLMVGTGGGEPDTEMGDIRGE